MPGETREIEVRESSWVKTVESDGTICGKWHVCTLFEVSTFQKLNTVSAEQTHLQDHHWMSRPVGLQSLATYVKSKGVALFQGN